MKQINEVVYHKLIMQAKEAKRHGFDKMGDAILGAVGSFPDDQEKFDYDHQQLEDDLYHGMWKLATHVLKFHEVESADAGQIHDRLQSLAHRFLLEVESSLKIDAPDDETSE